MLTSVAIKISCILLQLNTYSWGTVHYVCFMNILSNVFVLGFTHLNHCVLLEIAQDLLQVKVVMN